MLARQQINPCKINLLLRMERCVYMKRLVSSCLTSLVSGRPCCGRIFIPRACSLPQSALRNLYASTSVTRNATGNEDHDNLQSIHKAKGKVKGTVSVNLPETKKEVISFNFHLGTR